MANFRLSFSATCREDIPDCEFTIEGLLGETCGWVTETSVPWISIVLNGPPILYIEFPEEEFPEQFDLKRQYDSPGQQHMVREEGGASYRFVNLQLRISVELDVSLAPHRGAFHYKTLKLFK